jgi:predicted amidohydrolase
VVTVQTDFGIWGLATCYDLRFPELFRAMVDQGAEAFLVCSAWPYPRLEHWLMLNRVRALENEAFLISSNCVGSSRGKHFCGHSLVVDPWGCAVAGAGDEPGIVWADVDPAAVARVRSVFPPLRDRVLGVPREERSRS